MEKSAKIALLSIIICFNVYGQTTTPRYIPPSEYIALGQFDALLGSVSNAMNENSKNQTLGNLNTFLGRADLNAALKGLPSGKACIANGSHEQLGSAWMLDNAMDARVVMFNENHLSPASRTFVRAHLRELKEQGFTHIGFEALPAFDVISEENPEQAIASGYYTIEPMFSALIREAAFLGLKIFGYESPSTLLPQGNFEEQRNAREKFQAQNIINVINSASPDSKFIIYAGWSHIAEEPLQDSVPGGKFRWMASLFKEETGIDPLTIDLTQCFYASDESEGWEGKVFITDDGSPLIQGNYIGAVDAQIYLPAPSSPTAYNPNYYRKALGKSFQISDALRSSLFPVLVRARLAGSSKSAMAYDLILLRPGEEFPLYLKNGDYEITSYKGDGSVVGEQVVHIE